MSLYGKLLRIDLDKRDWEFLSCAGLDQLKLLGGRGFNAWYLYKYLSADVQPLDPENMLIFSCGLLTGTNAPASSRLHINALSPLTGVMGSSNVGGLFGARLRSCGIQSLVVQGRADQPVYLFLDDQNVYIKDALSLWGLDTWEVERVLKDRHGLKSKIMSIGPGGENQVLFSCILTDLDHAAGRTGMGAVMGSKNLKAIVLSKESCGDKSQKKMVTADEKEAIKAYVQQIKQAPEFKKFSKLGGSGYVKWCDDMGIMPTRNFQDNHFNAAEKTDGLNLEKYKVRSRGCARCPVQCKAELRIPLPRFKGLLSARPEFESMVNLGAKCGLEDLETIVYLDNLCSRLGLDCISTSGVLAFAMELYQRGILSRAETNGLDLSWGKGESMEELIRQIAGKQGLGAVLALGVSRAAQVIGKNSQKYAYHVKNMELSAYHPSELMGTALGYAVSARGGDFNTLYASLEYSWDKERSLEEFGTVNSTDIKHIQGKGILLRRAMIVNIVFDSLGICKVPALSLIGAFDLENEAALLSALCQENWQACDLYHLGEKVANLERLFNIKFGATCRDDCLPQWFFEYKSPKIKESANNNWLEPMLKDFYTVMGWDFQGRPTKSKLRELGLNSISTGSWG